MKIIIKKYLTSIILDILLLSSTIIYRFSDDRIFLYDTDFHSYFKAFPMILNIIFVAILSIYFYSLGKYASNKYKLDITFSLSTSIGITFFNILLLPFFLIRLLYYPILIILLFIISFIAYKEINFAIKSISNNIHKAISDFCLSIANIKENSLKKNNKPKIDGKQEKDKFIIVIKKIFISEIAAIDQIKTISKILSFLIFILIIFALGLHFIHAISPINYVESYGDIANSYFEVYMNLANSHGLKLIPNLAGTLSKFLNFEVLASTIIVLSNAETVKIFGFLMFILLSFMVYDFFIYIFKNSEWASFAILFFLLCPSFLDELKFSYNHDRNYLIFLSFLSFFIMFIGINKKEMNYHYINLPLMGILLGINQAGIISVIINLIIMLLFSRECMKNKKKLIISFFIFLCIASVFPIWNYIQSGSFMPTNTLFGKLFVANINPDVFDQYLSERVGLQFKSPYISPFDFLAFPFNFVYRQYYILAIPFLFGSLLTIKNRNFGMIYVYIILNMLIYILLFKSSVKLGINARFHFVILPLIIISIAYVISKWNFLNLVKCLWSIKSISFAIIFIFFFIHIDDYCFILPQFKINTINSIKCQIRKKIDYITGNINLFDYIEKKNVDKIEFINNNFNRHDKILYFFHAQGIYVKPQLYQNTKPGVSVLYTSGNQKQIMDKLFEHGINYLCIDSKWYILPNNPFGVMSADITTPIFEPNFFSKYFVPQRNKMRNILIFKINYNGITKEKDIINNKNKIARTGLFGLIYKGIKRNIDNEKLVRFKLNPYKMENLLEEYEKCFTPQVLNKWMKEGLTLY